MLWLRIRHRSGDGMVRASVKRESLECHEGQGLSKRELEMRKPCYCRLLFPFTPSSWLRA